MKRLELDKNIYEIDGIDELEINDRNTPNSVFGNWFTSVKLYMSECEFRKILNDNPGGKWYDSIVISNDDDVDYRFKKGIIKELKGFFTGINYNSKTKKVIFDIYCHEIDRRIPEKDAYIE